MQTKQLSGSGNYLDFAATGAWWVTGLKITEEDVPFFFFCRWVYFHCGDAEPTVPPFL